MYRSAHTSSKLSKDGSLSTPYAPRPFKARASMSTDYPEAQHRNMAWRKDYYSLSDPHLTHYFRAKVLSSPNRPRSRAMSSLSFRTQDSNVSTRSCYSSASQCPAPPQSVYKVIIKTGQLPDAGTTARAHITLQGSKGTLKRRRLTRSGGDEFFPGKSATFRVRGRDVGPISQVTLESDGLRNADSWFVESVAVVNEKGKKWVCPCNHWLSLYHTDRQLSRTLKAKPVPAGKTGLTNSPVVYALEVHTGDVRGAGTSANVFVMLEGIRSSSSKQLIAGGESGGFDRGSVVRSEVTCQADLGRVRRLVIGHDNSGFGSDWFLDHVILRAPEDKLYFGCGQWLSRTQGDGLIERALVPSPTPTPQLPRHAYRVDIITGAMRGAGTDANVFVTLFGEKGTSGERCLDNDPANFERGRTDTFSLYCTDLGTLNKVLVRHDNSGVGASWFLERVEVTKMGGAGSETIKFPCGQWLEECEGCGGKLEVELVPEGSLDYQRSKKMEARYPYKVTVVTGSRPGGGTSANVYVVLCGKEGDCSNKVWLDSHQRTLVPGQTDSFEVSVYRLVSPVDALIIGHDNTGLSPGWFLEEVRVDCCTTAAHWVFPCQQWLCSDTGDGRIERELHPLAPNNAHSDHSLPWEVRVFTSDLRGAGTDANVTLQVHGNEGSSTPVPLGDNIANFERGECDVFRGVLIPTSVGRTLESVTVSHDGSNPYPEWHLERVELLNAHLGQEYHFNCGRWLSAENGNSVQLTAVQVAMPPHSNIYDMVTNGHLTPPRTSLTNGSQPSSLTNGHHPPSSTLTNEHHPSSSTLTNGHHHSSLTNGNLSPLSLSSIHSSTIPYTVHVVGGAPPEGSPTPYLELVLCGEGSSPPIALEPLGTRPSPGTPETYSVEGANIGDLTHIKLRLVGPSGAAWVINEVTVHSPTSGHTHHFPFGRGLVAGEEACAVKAVELLESSINTSTMVSTPRTSNSKLIAYEVRVSTADKKSAGVSNSLYLMLLGDKLSSKVFTLKNSTKHAKLQRGQTDIFQVATPPLGTLKSVKVAHCPRRRHRDAASAESEDASYGGNWYLFHVVLTNLQDRTKAYFLCRKWVEPSPSPHQLNYTEIALSKTV